MALFLPQELLRVIFDFTVDLPYCLQKQFIFERHPLITICLKNTGRFTCGENSRVDWHCRRSRKDPKKYNVYFKRWSSVYDDNRLVKCCEWNFRFCEFCGKSLGCIETYCKDCDLEMTLKDGVENGTKCYNKWQKFE